MKKYRRAAVWMHRTMRLSDNAALWHAVREADEVIPLLFLNPSRSYDRDSPRRLFLRGTIRALDESLHTIGSFLTVVPGDPIREFPSLVRSHHIEAVFTPETHDPRSIARDRAIAAKLAAQGCAVHFFRDSLLFGRGDLLTGAGEPYKVFTPFCARAMAGLHDVVAPYPRIRSLRTPSLAGQLTLSRFPAFSRFDRNTGEKSALRRLRWFVGKSLDAYSRHRDLPGIDGTSRLSPHLSSGSIGIRTVLDSVLASAHDSIEIRSSRHDVFIKELLWREFYAHVLMHFPAVVDGPFNEKFRRVPWSDNQRHWSRWCEGLTGYPIVDAGMRQLQQEGWMHNRVRMVVASFLTKDLHINWQKGEGFFFERLLDGDIASNNGGWQWVAGSGTDAAPYFRIFNPVRQSERFDPDGIYIRKYVPELSKIPAQNIHAPWELSPSEQRRTGCIIGRHYPAPIVDHNAEREIALALLKKRS